MAVIPVDYHPYGAARELFSCRRDEVVISGPAGTGKSLSCLFKLHKAAYTYPGMRGLIVRKTRESLTQSALITMNTQVLLPTDEVTWYGNSEYRYTNGSRLVTGGLDKSSKVMSAFYDMIYPQEATELTLADWEDLTTRLRNWVMPYQQMIADCNPGPPTHWLLDRARSGALLMLESRHEDNPRLFDPVRRQWTAEGEKYIAVLEKLSGVRYLRLRKGIWAAAEGMVYEDWDRARHVISDRSAATIPPQWPRFWAVDFGYVHAFAWGAFAVDPDGRIYLYREIHHTGRLVEDHARRIKEITKNDPRPRAIICDHDAEDRATLERHLGMKTLAAFKSISPGIQAVATRLRPALPDGRPRLLICADALDERDPTLLEKHKPLCLADEMESYCWDTRSGVRKGEAPVKEDDDAADCLRYVVCFIDHVAGGRAATPAAG